MAGRRIDPHDQAEPTDCRLTDWLAQRGLHDATVLALVPNAVIDRLTRAQRERVAVLLESLHQLGRHHGRLAGELRQRAQLELDRLLS
jgi:hypothetical protein